MPIWLTRLFVLMLLWPFAAIADDAPFVGNIQKALTPDSLLLQDGQVVRLDGIFCCLDAGDTATATAALQNLIDGKSLALENMSGDRYGRKAGTAYAVDADSQKVWLQGAMLDEGMAFVYPPRGDEDQLDDMLAHENAARVARRGIWAKFTELDGNHPDDWQDENYGHFAFVKGTVVKAERVKNMMYLNFGDDWRRDFTVAIPAHDLHFFKKLKIDPLGYQSKVIRVRGWIKRDAGPMITVTHPSQIEMLAANADIPAPAAPEPKRKRRKRDQNSDQ